MRCEMETSPSPTGKNKKTHQPGNAPKTMMSKRIESVWNNHVWVHRILKIILDSHIHWIALHRFPSTSQYLSNIILQQNRSWFLSSCSVWTYVFKDVLAIDFKFIWFDHKAQESLFLNFHERKLSCDAAEAMAPAGESNARCAFQCAYVQVQVYIYI